jgi:hypothetical protein
VGAFLAEPLREGNIMAALNKNLRTLEEHLQDMASTIDSAMAVFDTTTAKGAGGD